MPNSPWNNKIVAFSHYLFNITAASNVESCVKGTWLIFDWDTIAPVLIYEYAIHISLQERFLYEVSFYYLISPKNMKVEMIFC